MLCMLCLQFTLSRCRPKSRSPVQHLGHSTIITLYPASSLSPRARLPTHPYFLFSWVGLRGSFKIPETLLLDDRMWNAQSSHNLGTTQYFTLPQAAFQSLRLLHWHLSHGHSFMALMPGFCYSLLQPCFNSISAYLWNVQYLACVSYSPSAIFWLIHLLINSLLP